MKKTGSDSTLTHSRPDLTDPLGPAAPGAAALFVAGKAAFQPLALLGGKLQVHRAAASESRPGILCLDDERVSREHLSVAWLDGRWRLEDLNSRNGTRIDAAPLKGTREVAGTPIITVGNSLIWLVSDGRPLMRQAVEIRGEQVLGPGLQSTWESIRRISEISETLHLLGESGTGKELAARHFHACASGQGPFVAVNCAGIPEGLAERLFFGARKGAYSGADRDADGYLQAAHGGTLFLDEIGELQPQVQAKLLRALETHEVLPLGATRGHEVRFKLCSATHRDLREEVASGDFREDLYFRLGRPMVTLAPLRERLEEIPWLLTRAIGPVGVSLVEACLLRPWPGNVRELLIEARSALAAAAGTSVGAEHLPSDAGRRLESADAAVALPDDDQIRESLALNGGNVSATARALKIHRTQLRRWVARNPTGSSGR